MNEIELKLRENRRKRMTEGSVPEDKPTVFNPEDDPELEEIPGGISGYYMFRKRDKVTGKGKWWVKPYDPRLGDTTKMYPITYKQALGEEPISLKEYAWDDEDETTGRYKKIRTKSVQDSDGFSTDYTLYQDTESDHYVCIFGDNDYYKPEDTEPDMEFDDESEALEWFDSYTGFEEDFDESKKETSIRSEHTPMSTSTKPQINEAFVESEAILQGLTKVRTEAREAYSKYANMQDLAECKAILTYLVKDSKTLLDLVNEALAGKSVDESKVTESKWGIETDILDDIEAIILGKKSVDDSTLKDAEFMIGAGGEGMIYLPDVDTFDIKVSPRRGAVKIENKETESQINEASLDDEEGFDEFEEEEYDDGDVVASNWKRLKDLQGDFWTNLDELVEDIEDKLGYEVVFKSREYLSIIDPDAEDDEEYKLTLGGTERTIVVELDSSYPM